MKRCFSVALILALLGTAAPAMARAEDTDVVSANVEAQVALAPDAGDTGLTVEGYAEPLFEEPFIEEPFIEEAYAGDLEIAVSAAEEAAVEEITDDMEVMAAAAEAEDIEYAVEAAASDLKLSATTLTLSVGQTQKLSATLSGAAVTPAYSSSSACVSVSADGTITAVSAGSAVVTATSGAATASCAVTVTASSAGTPVSLSVNFPSLLIAVKEAYRGIVVEGITDTGATVAVSDLEWKSSNKKVAKVDPATGAVIGVKKGSCTLTAKQASTGLTVSVKLKVKKAPKKVVLSPKSGVITVGTSGSYKVKFPSGTGCSVTFSSSDESIAIVDGTGRVTGVAPGTVTITAKPYKGKAGKATLVVKASNATTTDDGTNQASAANADKLEYVIKVAQDLLGKPYVYGSFGPNSFDCSGFTTYCFRQINVELKHSAYTQGYDTSQQQLGIESLRRGDLVFFNTVDDGADDLSDHSGLYLGNGKFIHASSSAKKVIISTLSSGYYNRVFSWGRRVLD